MNRLTIFLALAGISAFASACGGGGVDEQTSAEEPATPSSTPVVTFKPDEKHNITGKPAGPVKISYRIIGTPVVGHPVTVDLKVESNVGDMPITLSYTTNDSTAMTALGPARH